MIRTAAVIGLGKLGLPMAACLAERGLQVIGVDLDESRVAALRGGECPIYEPGLEDLLRRVRARFTATTDVGEAVSTSDASFVIVPTPSLPDGSFSLDHVLSACEAVGLALRSRDSHLVVVTSTVSPGSTYGPVRAVLEKASGKQAGVDFGLCYSPEFIALGSVIENFLRPDFVLVGEGDEASGSALAEMYGRVCDGDPPIARMVPINAEITKIALNSYITTKIAFANMLSDMCEGIDGGDVDAVTAALGLDTRIGSRYLRGGLGFGGPCFPRDNRALATFARSIGVEPFLADATDASNAVHGDHVADVVRQVLPTDGTVGILGLSYKANTDVTERSAGLELAAALARDGVKIVSYDPMARPLGGESFELGMVDAMDECVAAADVLVVSTPWAEIVGNLPATISRIPGPRVVVDCWRSFDPSVFPPTVRYIPLGCG